MTCQQIISRLFVTSSQPYYICKQDSNDLVLISCNTDAFANTCLYTYCERNLFLSLTLQRNVMCTNTNNIINCKSDSYSTNYSVIDNKYVNQFFLLNNVATSAYCRDNACGETACIGDSNAIISLTDRYVLAQVIQDIEWLINYIQTNRFLILSIFKFFYILYKRPECLQYNFCRHLFDLIGFYNDTYTAGLSLCVARSTFKDLFSVIAMLPYSTTYNITREQYLNSIQALITGIPSSGATAYNIAINDPIILHALAYSFARNPKGYIYYTTSFIIDDPGLNTFATALLNEPNTYLDPNHPLHRDLLIVLFATDLI